MSGIEILEKAKLLRPNSSYAARTVVGSSLASLRDIVTSS